MQSFVLESTRELSLASGPQKTRARPHAFKFCGGRGVAFSLSVLITPRPFDQVLRIEGKLLQPAPRPRELEPREERGVTSE
jgi:hypothetical protein